MGNKVIAFIFAIISVIAILYVINTPLSAVDKVCGYIVWGVLLICSVIEKGD